MSDGWLRGWRGRRCFFLHFHVCGCLVAGCEDSTSTTTTTTTTTVCMRCAVSNFVHELTRASWLMSSVCGAVRFAMCRLVMYGATELCVYGMVTESHIFRAKTQINQIISDAARALRSRVSCTQNDVRFFHTGLPEWSRLIVYFQKFFFIF